MIMVAPDDLANLCAAFIVLRTARLRLAHLLDVAMQSLRIDASASPTAIVASAVECSLISCDGKTYILTKAGQQVGLAQGGQLPRLSREAGEMLMKRVYLNRQSGKACCAEFLLDFIPDAEEGTFVCQRSDNESSSLISRIKALERVGLLAVEKTRMKVMPKYLPLVNELLRQVRQVPDGQNPEDAERRNAIGDVAEEKACLYEKERLVRNGHEELAAAVQRISLIDQSRGFDVLSFRGSGKTPQEEMLIEVKGTQGHAVQFCWSANEMRVARDTRKKYWIYCYTDVNLEERDAKGPIRINDPSRNVTSTRYELLPMEVFVRRRTV